MGQDYIIRNALCSQYLYHHTHCCGSFRTTVEVYIGTNETGKAAHHGKAETEALDLLMPRGDGAIELVEDFLALLSRNATAGIGEDDGL